jgi:hypothetical protein
MLTVGGAIRLGGPGGVTADDAAMVGRATAVTITGPVSSIINLLVSFIFTPLRPQAMRSADAGNRAESHTIYAMAAIKYHSWRALPPFSKYLGAERALIATIIALLSAGIIAGQ